MIFLAVQIMAAAASEGSADAISFIENKSRDESLRNNPHAPSPLCPYTFALLDLMKASSDTEKNKQFSKLLINQCKDCFFYDRVLPEAMTFLKENTSPEDFRPLRPQISQSLDSNSCS